MNLVHFQMVGSNLKFSNELTVSLRSASSFRIKKHCAHQIEILRYDKTGGKIYETTFQLYFENLAEIHACISHFLKETTMTPSLFFTRSVKPIVNTPSEEKAEVAAPNCGHAAIEFEFSDKVDSDYFLTYAAPLISDFETQIKKNTDGYCALLISKLTEDADKQVKRIKAVFSNLVKQFGNFGIHNALIHCKDDRFAKEPIHHSSHDFEHMLDEQRKKYHVTKDEIFEIFCGLQLKVESEDMISWFQNPTNDRASALIKCEKYLIEKIIKSIRDNDDDACKKWLECVGSIPGLNAICILKGLKEVFSPF